MSPQFPSKLITTPDCRSQVRHLSVPTPQPQRAAMDGKSSLPAAVSRFGLLVVSTAGVLCKLPSSSKAFPHPQPFPGLDL